MGFGTAIHYFGSLLLLVGAVLLVVASVSAPTVTDISFLRVNIADNKFVDYVTFGAFGYCVTGPAGKCSSAMVGYNPASVLGLNHVGDNIFSNAGEDTVKALTHVFVLHPVAAGITFIGFLLSLKTGFLSLVTALISFLGFLIAVVCVAVDFAAFVIVRHDINKADDANNAEWGVAIWLTLASAVAILLGTVIVFITCCAGRRRSRYENRKVGY